MSYGALWNFIQTSRGPGKTFWFTKFALHSKGQTVWVRRYKEDMNKQFFNSFMQAQYSEGNFLDDTIVIKDDTLYFNGEPKIFFISLSLSHKKKSTAYPNVNYIVFDEFVELGSNRAGYLKDECTKFLELYETINRLRIDGRPDVRVFFLGNKVSFLNPYYNFFSIRPFKGRFKKFKKGLIVVENYDNPKFTELKKESKFGRLIAGTKYSEYAIDNISLRDNDDYIETMPEGCNLRCNIRLGDRLCGLWNNPNGKWYLSLKANKTELTYAPREDLKVGEFALISSKPPLSTLKTLHTVGLLYFEDSILKGIGFDLLQNPYK